MAKKKNLTKQDIEDVSTFETYLPLKTNGHNGISINVPEPTAYVLHKFIVSGRRKKSFKREKDIETARQLGEYLLEQEKQRKKMHEIYVDMADKWKRDLMRIVKGASEKIYTFLNSI